MDYYQHPEEPLPKDIEEDHGGLVVKAEDIPELIDSGIIQISKMPSSEGGNPTYFKITDLQFTSPEKATLSVDGEDLGDPIESKKTLDLRDVSILVPGAKLGENIDLSEALVGEKIVELYGKYYMISKYHPKVLQRYFNSEEFTEDGFTFEDYLAKFPQNINNHYKVWIVDKSNGFVGSYDLEYDPDVIYFWDQLKDIDVIEDPKKTGKFLLLIYYQYGNEELMGLSIDIDEDTIEKWRIVKKSRGRGRA